MNFINAFIAIVLGILGNIIAAWLQPKLENWKKITIFIFLVLASYSLIVTLFQKVEEVPKQVENIKTQTNIQDNHGTVNNIENQTINNNYIPQNADNKVVVKENSKIIAERKQEYIEIILEINENKFNKDFKIFVDEKQADIIDNTYFMPTIRVQKLDILRTIRVSDGKKTIEKTQIFTTNTKLIIS